MWSTGPTAAWRTASPVADMRRSAEQDVRGAGWARAKFILRELLELEVGPVHEIGWVKKIGEGISREACSDRFDECHEGSTTNRHPSS